jgi:hypothetical protein
VKGPFIDLAYGLVYGLAYGLAQGMLADSIKNLSQSRRKRSC